MEKKVEEERRLAITVDNIPLMDSYIVPELASPDKTALHQLQFTILVTEGVSTGTGERRNAAC
jgi:hypothetical protein